MNIGGAKSKVVPRFYFSKRAPEEARPDIPKNHKLRYDYEARFPIGTGPIATDEENRIIHPWTDDLADISDDVWRAMQDDPKFKSLCNGPNPINHVSVHFYRAGNEILPHEDRRRNGNNSMRENSAVAVLTVGDPRRITFSQKYRENGKIVVEDEPCYQFEQCHGTLFVLHPADETMKNRRNRYGQRREEATFVHRVDTEKDKDYVSIAFVFRSLVTTAEVDSWTDRVVPTEPATAKEAARRRERMELRKQDEKPRSPFMKKVEKVQAEWRRLLELKGWT